MKLDSVDRLLISLLKQNARETNIALAKQAGLTEGAVRRRISQLLASGIIKRFTIETTSEGGFFAIALIKAENDVKKVIHRIAATQIPVQSYEISGEFDGCILLNGESIEAIDLQIDRIRKINGVRDTKTYMVMKKW